MEYHIFFRTTSAAKVKQGAKSNFARTGSRFRFRYRKKNARSFFKEKKILNFVFKLVVELNVKQQH